MKILAPFLLVMLMGRAVVGSGCYGDNCANHVTGTWAGIGVPLASRISLCNKFLHTTVKPHAKTVTSTITKYTTNVLQASYTTRMSRNTTVATPPHSETVFPVAVPTFAAAQCPEAGQFSSACLCWGKVTARTTTLATPTITATTTQWLNVACGPAAAAVSPEELFPCSGRWGMCACLRAGAADDQVCVRVGSFFGERPGHGGNSTGPCAQVDECDVNGRCDRSGHVCVYDGSCGCGKRRCYRAAPDGCDYQGLPMDDMKRGHF